MNVFCPVCKKSFHETTEAFSPYSPAKGNMVRLRDPYKKWGWSMFSGGLSQAACDRFHWSQMACPGCGSLMAIGGKLWVKNEDGSEYIPPPPPPVVDNTVDGRLVFDTDYSDLESEWNDRLKGGFLVCPVCGKKYADTEKGKIWYGKHLEVCK